MGCAASKGEDDAALQPQHAVGMELAQAGEATTKPVQAAPAAAAAMKPAEAAAAVAKATPATTAAVTKPVRNASTRSSSRRVPREAPRLAEQPPSAGMLPSPPTATTSEPKNVSSRAPDENDEALREWLHANNVDTSLWGEGTSKTVGSLRNELKNKESELVLEEGRPLRSLRVARVRVHRSASDQRYLWEVKQLLPEGQERPRGMPLSEKLKFDETQLDGAARGIREELEGRACESLRAHHETIEIKPTQTYPGLVCRYTFCEVEAVVEDLPEDSFETTEVDGGKQVTHCWDWRMPLVQPDDDLILEPVQTRLLERLFSDCSSIRATPLHGGLSGDLVLRVSPYYLDEGGSGKERPDDPTVVKLGGAVGIVNEVRQTSYVASIGGGDAGVRVMRGPFFTDEQSTNVLQYADATIDGPLRERLKDGSLRLLRCDWLGAPSSTKELNRDPDSQRPVIKRRQDLPPDAFFLPKDAVALLDRGNRSILAVSHCWQTAKHPDPHGATLELIRRYLAEDPSTKGCGLFWDFVSMPQKDAKSATRTKGEDTIFKGCLNCMSYVRKPQEELLACDLAAAMPAAPSLPCLAHSRKMSRHMLSLCSYAAHAMPASPARRCFVCVVCLHAHLLTMAASSSSTRRRAPRSRSASRALAR